MSTNKDIYDWYCREITKAKEELIEVTKRINEKMRAYVKHIFANTGKAYALTKKEASTHKVQMVSEFKKDYKDLQNEYLALCHLITRKYFLLDTISRLEHDRKVDYEQLRNKDN